MTSPRARRQAQLPLGGKLRLFYGVEVGGGAAVAAEACGFFQIAVLLQVVQGALYGADGQLQFPGYGFDPGPALVLLVGAVLQIHIDRLGPVGQVLIGIDALKVAHPYTLGPACLEDWVGAGKHAAMRCSSIFRSA